MDQLELGAHQLVRVGEEVEQPKVVATAYSELHPVSVEQQARAAVEEEVVEVEPSVALALVELSADFHHPVDLDLTVALEQVEDVLVAEEEV